ncbi:MAG: ComF family protein [Gammaproteobacteria bacterium]|nr:ComF family protein [Gammaproteobacteria bacterium]NNF49577.1 ComF family protein [Woeseiaceae bacterium]NNL63954.1 ComF family protein [Woeseiaceae bacterium]
MPLLRLLAAFDDALMPLRCVFCGTRTIGDERFVCIGCARDLPAIVSSPAPGSPLAAEVAPFAFEFPVDAAIKALKFRRRLFYAPALAQLLCGACAELPPDIDAVLPVPLHWRRKWLRGFNQALEIARPVARRLDVPVIHNVYRRRATPAQSGLSAAKRASNLRAAFRVRGSLPYRHVLIVDDVITTGATVRELARALIKAGPDRVSALAVARA